MLAQAIIVRDQMVLMVREYVDRGDLVWNLPGGSCEGDETREEACIREVKEETGYEVRIRHPLFQSKAKTTYLADIIGGQLTEHPVNEPSIIDVTWVRLDDTEKFDAYILPLISIYLASEWHSCHNVIPS